jgi:predicted nucleotidyltransferase
MDKQDRDLILELKRRLPDDTSAHVRKVIAFGSRARGQGREDSDLDLLILVDRKTPELESRIEDVAYRLMWDHDFRPILSVKIFTEDAYRKALAEGFSFYRSIEREGVAL